MGAAVAPDAAPAAVRGRDDLVTVLLLISGTKNSLPEMRRTRWCWDAPWDSGKRSALLPGNSHSQSPKRWCCPGDCLPPRGGAGEGRPVIPSDDLLFERVA